MVFDTTIGGQPGQSARVRTDLGFLFIFQIRYLIVRVDSFHLGEELHYEERAVPSSRRAGSFRAISIPAKGAPNRLTMRTLRLSSRSLRLPEGCVLVPKHSTLGRHPNPRAGPSSGTKNLATIWRCPRKTPTQVETVPASRAGFEIRGRHEPELVRRPFLE